MYIGNQLRVRPYQRRHSLLKRNLVSPLGLAAISSCIFLLAWLLPPSIYTHYLGEQDHIFLHVIALSFFASCVLGFCLGYALTNSARLRQRGPEKSIETPSPLAFLMTPLLASTFLCAYSGSLLLSSVPNLLSLLTTQQGALVKLAGNAGELNEGMWSYAVFLHMGILWWSFWRSRQLKLTRTKTYMFRITLAIAVLVGIGTSLVRVDRTSLMPMLAGLVTMYVYAKSSAGKRQAAKVLAYSFGGGVLLILMFTALSYIRGAKAGDDMVASLIGYSLASYNRLAVVLDGILKYPFAGHGLYLSSFVAYNNTLNAILPVSKLVNAPPYDQVFLSEFPAIAAAGLHKTFNWPSAFGYIYAELGWWTPLYLMPIGALCGICWRAFKAHRAIGLILYPWIAFSILFWFGWNILFDSRMAVLLLLACIMSAYETLFSYRTTAEKDVMLADAHVLQVLYSQTGPV